MLHRNLALAIALAVNGAAQRMPPMQREEREALLDFYRATDGDHWKRKDGWGNAASPCDWYGVACDSDDQRSVVRGLDLLDNNLRGSLPASLGSLRRLEYLNVGQNYLSGPFREELLERVDRDELDLTWFGNTFSNFITRARVEYTAGGVLCSDHEDVRYSAEFDAVTGRSLFQSIRCRKGTRRTYCLVREGQIISLFGLSRALKTLGFSNFAPEYNAMTQTHGLTLTTSVVWGDKSSKTVETYAGHGGIQVWMAQQLFLALIQEASWERQVEKPKCEGVR